nr:hypothetical protein [Tanacetum cinerariifolium]
MVPDVEVNLCGLLELDKVTSANSSGDFGPELSFNKSASSRRLFNLARVILAEASKRVLSFGCSRLITPDLIRPLTYRLLWNSSGDSEPDLSFDKSASVERLFSLALLGIYGFLCLPEWTGAEDLDVGTPSSKIVAKAEASQKRKASTSGAASSHFAKRNRSALAQSSGSTTYPSFFVGDDDERNLGGRFIAPAAEGFNIRDLWGKGIMVDDAAAPSAGVSRPRPSSGPAPSFRDVSGEAIYTDFFPFFVGPYYATYLEDGVDGNCEFNREEWDALY